MASSAGSGSKRRSVHSLCTHTNHPTQAAQQLARQPAMASSHALTHHVVTTVSFAAHKAAVNCAALGPVAVRHPNARVDCLMPFLNQPSTMPHTRQSQGQVLATGGDDAKVNLWRLGSASCIKVLPHAASEVATIAKKVNLTCDCTLWVTELEWPPKAC